MADFMRRWIGGRVTVACLMWSMALAAPAVAQAAGGREPDLGDHQHLRVQPGHKVAFQAYAEGVQIWRWNGMAWVFVKPEAVLYASGKDNGIVGIHYAGPTWESASGSYVVAAVIDRTTPNADAIPWLLLGAVASDGPGIFDGVTYIQRVNTRGGIAPAGSGDFPGDEARVPYTAEYFFYRKQN
jgi:hypothetical protein